MTGLCSCTESSNYTLCKSGLHVGAMQMPGAFSCLIMTCRFPGTSLSPRVGARPLELKAPFLHLRLQRTSFVPLSFLFRGLGKMLFWTVCQMCQCWNSGISDNRVRSPLYLLLPAAVPSSCPGTVARNAAPHMTTTGPPWASLMAPFKMQSVCSRVPRPIWKRLTVAEP